MPIAPKRDAGIGDQSAVAYQLDIVAAHQRIGERHAQPAGEVVVAGARRRSAASFGPTTSGGRVVPGPDATCMMLSIICATAGDASR